MTAGQPGPQPAKSAGPTAKLRASGPQARSKSRPVYIPIVFCPLTVQLPTKYEPNLSNHKKSYSFFKIREENDNNDDTHPP